MYDFRLAFSVGYATFAVFVFFVEFDTLDLEIFVICWIGSVDPVDDLCLTNQIDSALFNAVGLALIARGIGTLNYFKSNTGTAY